MAANVLLFTMEGEMTMANAVNYWFQKYLAEKKKVAELEEQVKTAEDHAYFAGSEAMREKLIDKACDFLETYPHMFMGILRSEMIDDFRKAMGK